MQLLSSPFAGSSFNFPLTIFIWIYLPLLLLHPVVALAAPKAGENFVPVLPPKHALATEPNGASTNETKHADNLLCTPFGACEPCPPDAMHEPFCLPFGNRRLMHCVSVSPSRPPPPSNPDTTTTHPLHPNAHDRKQQQRQPPPQPPPPHTGPGSTHSIPEIPAWESCGRIPSKERADFFEFVACNVLFAIIALGVLFFRERRLRLGRARVLAARIGIGGGGGGLGRR